VTDGGSAEYEAQLINMLLLVVCGLFHALHPAQLQMLQGPKYATECLLQKNAMNLCVCLIPEVNDDAGSTEFVKFFKHLS